ncbi:hypothetical protein GOP47_0004938 [Adiantum capillus-veneris]|uniref:dCMP deaminase n=2 Tax=Euphyllophyta TaxID=78536 RepID=A0A9D4V4M5_ADICA|nr:hypothetical protein GOP47_0004938 [Adiantum capillus-veneris]
MAAEAAEDAKGWMFPLLFAALALALGSFLYTAHFRLTWLFSALKIVSANRVKPASECGGRNTRGARSFLNNDRRTKKHKKALPNSCQSQLDTSLAIWEALTKKEQSKTNLKAFDDLPSGILRLAGECGSNDAQYSLNTKPDPYDKSKRQGYLSWDDYFMAIAFLSAHRSKDPNRQVGACLVSQDRVILGIGYNGFPRGCSDDELPWAKMAVNGDPLQTKYPYVCHAEVNAILNKNHASACGQRLYVTMFPCNECAKIIIQAGVAEVVYFTGKSSSSDCSYIASQKLLSMAGIKVWQHQPQQKRLILDFK